MLSIQQMLADGTEFDAIFAGDDDSAIGAIRALKMAGRVIPGRCSCGGFRRCSLRPLPLPALTTVSAPIEEIGREAVRQLARLMHRRTSPGVDSDANGIGHP